ncbi:hypothetical protein [Mesorhizobium huakuii]|uniref:hypothetical protein n=1 Tax=Mesorhizobium huakuii TaxID=28104 RepID=UPI001FD46609|nr:hypothetical protein [Mesorhizobium huakuii]
MATRSGYARTVRLWKRGADPLTAPMIFETGSETIGVSSHLDRTAESDRLWFIEKPAYFEQIVRIGDRSGPKVEIDLPRDAWWNGFDDWLAVKPRKLWTVGGTTYAADALIGISLSSFMAGERGFVTLFEPGERRSLQSFFWNNGELIISYLVNLVLSRRSRRAGRNGGAEPWTPCPAAGLLTFGHSMRNITRPMERSSFRLIDYAAAAFPT